MSKSNALTRWDSFVMYTYWKGNWLLQTISHFEWHNPFMYCTFHWLLCYALSLFQPHLIDLYTLSNVELARIKVVVDTELQTKSSCLAHYCIFVYKLVYILHWIILLWCEFINGLWLLQSRYLFLTNVVWPNLS